MRQGLAKWQSTGAGFLVPFFLYLLAELEAKARGAAAALVVVSEALRRVAETGEDWFEAELHRLSGELTLQTGIPSFVEAEAAFQRAAAIARRQCALLWELHAATSLARMWITQNQHQKAKALLVPLCARFTEGFSTFDLEVACDIAKNAAGVSDDSGAAPDN
jgi:predicted ATPase